MSASSNRRRPDSTENLRASSRSDLEAFCGSLDALDADRRVALMQRIWCAGYMLPTGALRPLLWIVRITRGEAGVGHLLRRLQQRNPDIFGLFWRQTLAHLLHGRDVEDRDSAGGYSQRELDQLQVWLREIA